MNSPLLEEICLLPGVQGGCLLDKAHRLLGQERMTNYDTHALSELGKRMARMLQMSRMLGLGVAAAELRYDRHLLVGVTLTGDQLLLALCNHDCNANLVSHTARLVAADHPSGGNGAGRSEDLDALELMDVEEEPVEANAKPGSWAPEVTAGIGLIREALVHTLGPMAIMLLDDYLNRWTTGGAPVAKRLPLLVDLIAADLSDATQIKTFRAFLAPR
ncbi:MAG: hypothetical protein BWK76_28400 [Desulfobulbaceae bacterium A2]|nr:MAG: hypothetical protein BWK76_28400 [Desulfobulbaceae bacterium A2]